MSCFYIGTFTEGDRIGIKIDII